MRSGFRVFTTGPPWQAMVAVMAEAEAEAVFDAMDASETPGARTSVDRCAIKLERSMPA